MRLATAHLQIMIRTWEDMDKTLVTLSLPDLERVQQAVAKGARAA